MQERPAKHSSPILPLSRLCNIVLRTAHIAVAGILVGGHAFGIEPDRLLPYVYLAVITGIVLMMLEAYPDWRYWSEGCGALVVGKVLLLGFIPWMWHARVPILLLVMAIGSFGSHMPRRLRHYSFIERRVVDKGK